MLGDGSEIYQSPATSCCCCDSTLRPRQGYMVIQCHTWSSAVRFSKEMKKGLAVVLCCAVLCLLLQIVSMHFKSCQHGVWFFDVLCHFLSQGFTSVLRGFCCRFLISHLGAEAHFFEGERDILHTFIYIYLCLLNFFFVPSRVPIDWLVLAYVGWMMHHVKRCPFLSISSFSCISKLALTDPLAATWW